MASTLDNVTSTPLDKRARLLLYGSDGWGKTSLGACFPKPVFILSPGETGLHTLMRSGLVQDTAHFPVAHDWIDVCNYSRDLVEQAHDWKTLVIDTLNGIETLAIQRAIDSDFGGDAGEHGYLSYGNGSKITVRYLRTLSAMWETLTLKGMTVLLLAHAVTVTFQNPSGSDYDKYQGALERRYAWPYFKQSADCVFFGTFEQRLREARNEKAKAKVKATATPSRRVMYTESCDAWDAKNRYGMPYKLDMGNTPKESYGIIARAIARQKPITNGDANNAEAQ